MLREHLRAVRGAAGPSQGGESWGLPSGLGQGPLACQGLVPARAWDDQEAGGTAGWGGGQGETSSCRWARMLTLPQDQGGLGELCLAKGPVAGF